MYSRLSVNGDTTVLAGTEIRAESEAPMLTIGLREMDSGSWVIVDLPGYSSAATGTAETSLDALRSATGTAFYHGDGELWVKLVSNGGRADAGGPNLQDAVKNKRLPSDVLSELRRLKKSIDEP